MTSPLLRCPRCDKLLQVKLYDSRLSLVCEPCALVLPCNWRPYPTGTRVADAPAAQEGCRPKEAYDYALALRESFRDSLTDKTKERRTFGALIYLKLLERELNPYLLPPQKQPPFRGRIVVREALADLRDLCYALAEFWGLPRMWAGEMTATPAPSEMPDPPGQLIGKIADAVERLGIALASSEGEKGLWEGTRTNSVSELDVREVPLDAPQDTPSPLREAYEAAGQALFDAAEMRRQPPTGRPMFADLSNALADALQGAAKAYATAELLLQAVADDGQCAHREALNAITRVNDACGHVMRDVVPFEQATDHLRNVPAFDLAEMLRAMRRQTSRAAILLQTNRAKAATETRRVSQDKEEKPGDKEPVTHHPDGLEGGCWLWWKGKRHDVPKGVVYRLIAFMWDRDFAGYDLLEGPVFEEAIFPDSLRARVSEANKALKRIGIPWLLKTDSTSRVLTKRQSE